MTMWLLQAQQMHDQRTQEQVQTTHIEHSMSTHPQHKTQSLAAVALEACT